ncbi:arsenate reductase ArsC [Clostridium tyrobutyricum]|uniref:arsenate reductase ArsC n=1 Tax=Clostridium tyrobutyricum TaxID=1519 RepID=UPI00057DE059|nr:arsenate reductase ArsC [Clostridium tyrobutyricum]MBV4416481.1 arsenate reductase ArsC [Clostridium tyrobutyricum]MBV4422102.1 arsenate reductase ArsC [Clostridium tyrobutyricum]MEA5007189.1 arsenate reductase ArsC [Clostridium tyrobutyricum]
MKPKVAFICVHNSCRSQMAEAIGRLYGSELFDSYSAGTEIKSKINKDAVKVIQKLYSIDISEIQHVKLIDDLPEIDIVVKMGCNVACPFLPSKYEEDWGLEDPTGKSDEEFIKTAKIIEEKVKGLANKIRNKEIKL